MGDEPTSVRDEVNLAKDKLWSKDMKEEMNYLHKGEKSDLVKLPNEMNSIGCKWLFKKKINSKVNSRITSLNWWLKFIPMLRESN